MHASMASELNYVSLQSTFRHNACMCAKDALAYNYVEPLIRHALTPSLHTISLMNETIKACMAFCTI